MAYNPNIYLPYQTMLPTYQPSGWTQPSTAQQPINGLVSVTGIEGARAYQLPPNSSMPLFDNDNDVLYLKTTDAAGYPTIRAFSFKPMEEPKHAAQAVEYVPRSEFDALAEKVRSMLEGKHGE